jgi:hypothetical protein
MIMIKTKKKKFVISPDDSGTFMAALKGLV